ncbi:TetR/AcrR family transcriptional regulator [Pseudomonas sp. S 311-6]|uniref:TetR/AcrR family transcriptional regulator n=1 Tax=Pseudomonas TaxID=286 RepID=UPI002096E2D5|nr:MULTISPECIES: TetR/AcrR family transcriptional regulator [Pseudomonas]MCO7568213.1 TetR/AcrR family transcriptional regulator [Pseudomonas mosselii]MCO7619898.1 TetR/AcrR family transcriptional regulator [Pseudomonas guariconensis]MCO7643650.1 TetR/AcrR family transcriptional regulator [Pseudomonas sp. S 311-6]
MKALSPSAARVCDAAVGHFAQYGYDASSLNEIAQRAGIRKASLYAHFANKDALFVEVFQRALAHETAFVEHAFRQEAADDVAPGHWLVLHLAERYQASANLRFILRTAFAPPASIKPIVTSGFERYLDLVREGFCQALRARYGWAHTQDTRLEVYADAYLGIIDSLHVELMYAAPAVYARRAASLLKILDDSLSLNP